MALFAGVHILHPDLHADFHRRTEHAVHLRFKLNQFTDTDGMQKSHLIDGRRYDRTARVANGSDRTAQIYQVHDVTAEHMAQRIGVIWQADLVILGYGFAHSSRIRTAFSLDDHGLRIRFAHLLVDRRNAANSSHRTRALARTEIRPGARGPAGLWRFQSIPGTSGPASTPVPQ